MITDSTVIFCMASLTLSRDIEIVWDIRTKLPRGNYFGVGVFQRVWRKMMTVLNKSADYTWSA